MGGSLTTKIRCLTQITQVATRDSRLADHAPRDPKLREWRLGSEMMLLYLSHKTKNLVFAFLADTTSIEDDDIRLGRVDDLSESR